MWCNLKIRNRLGEMGGLNWFRIVQLASFSENEDYSTGSLKAEHVLAR
jgi:hypothetical protein